MPNTARILKFPHRSARNELSPEEAHDLALRYLEGRVASEQAAANADVLLALSAELRELTDSTPVLVAEKAAMLYGCVSKAPARIGFFDEQDYFLGEFALIAGAAFRHTGEYEVAGRWLDRAEAAFRHIVNAAPQLANVAYARLTLFYQLRRFEEVLQLTPSLIRSFERLRMTPELRKAEFLTAMALKQCGRDGEAFARFWELRNVLEREGDQALLGHVLIETGGYLSAEGRQEEALSEYSHAAELLAAANREMALAHLRVTIGEGLRERGDLQKALGAFRSAVAMYGKLQMATFVAYTQVFVADVLLRLNRPREAEWEILAALPTIEEQKMVPEGFAAVALLKESVRRRKTDPNALRELREHLQANKN